MLSHEMMSKDMSETTLQTEFEFTLPRGYVDEEGNVHKEGRMRLATAADEIKPLNDPRVQENSSYLTVVLLSRVVTQLGTIEDIDTDVIESLFVPDLEHLQRLYEQVNDGSTDFEELMTQPENEPELPESSTGEDDDTEADLEMGNA